MSGYIIHPTLLCDCTPVILPLSHFVMQGTPGSLNRTSSPSRMDSSKSACLATGLTFGYLHWELKIALCGTVFSSYPDLEDILYKNTASAGGISPLSVLAFMVGWFCSTILFLPGR